MHPNSKAYIAGAAVYLDQQTRRQDGVPKRYTNLVFKFHQLLISLKAFEKHLNTPER